MRNKDLLLLTLVALAVSCKLLLSATTFPDLYKSYAEGMKSYAEIIRAQAEYIRMVAEARLQWARAQLTLAQAAKEWEEVRRLRDLINRMELELRRLASDEYKQRRTIQAIESNVRTISVINVGRTNAYVFQALRFLFIRVIPGDIIAKVLSQSVPPFPKEQFIPNKKDVVDVLDFPGGTIGDLEQFVENNHYSFRPYGGAHLIFVASLYHFSSAAQTRLEELTKRMEAIRAGTLSIWNPPGVKPMEKPTPSKDSSTPTPPPKPSPDITAGDTHSHHFCLAAKGGFKSCREDGNSADTCLLADKGFSDCRKDGKGTADCISAKAGYAACRADGNSPSNCLAADSGYSDCRNDGLAPSACIKGKSGYKACRDEGLQPQFCLSADKGYTDCRNDGGSSEKCRAARGTYRACREDGFTDDQCLSVGKGYSQCRDNGYPPSECFKTDEGYRDCTGGFRAVVMPPNFSPLPQDRPSRGSCPWSAQNPAHST
ncbi:MAG: hypothetical protein HY537_11990 [Deltaproteobacteria bacterium]|nr:hypothetical protein [Deltaproteobacteria bacterium]